MKKTKTIKKSVKPKKKPKSKRFIVTVYDSKLKIVWLTSDFDYATFQMSANLEEVSVLGCSDPVEVVPHPSLSLNAWSN